jgi:hypothetical protein
MKCLFLLPVAFLSIALQAQTTNASGTASAAGAVSSQTRSKGAQAAASAASATNVSAELTRKIDTKNAKVGDEVNARTTSAAKLADGTNLPKGTKLVGKVVDTHAKSNVDKTSHLAFSLDRAVLRDGREVPVHAVLTSVTGTAASTSVADDMAMSSPGAGVGGSSGAQAGAGAPGVGGVLGGVGRTAGGVAGGAANTVGNAGGALRSGAGSIVNDTRTVGGEVASGPGVSGFVDHVPIANLPGVTMSSSTSAESAGSLDAAGRNISLESGTKMTLAVSAGQPQ